MSSGNDLKNEYFDVSLYGHLKNNTVHNLEVDAHNIVRIYEDNSTG